MPLAGGRFLIFSSNALYTVAGVDGFSQRVPIDECCGRVGPLLGGRALVMRTVAPDGSLAIVAADASTTTVTRSLQPHLGNGDGTIASGALRPGGSFTQAADGALVYVHALDAFGHRYALRAAVPEASTRVRMAFTQATFESFAAGRVGYLTSTPGRLEYELRRGDRVLARVSGTAHPPEGVLDVPRPDVGSYDVRLKLTTDAGGSAEARARMDTRTSLPAAEARAELTARFNQDAGDEGGSEGTYVGPCNRRNARRVVCVLLGFSSSYPLDGTDDRSFREWPVGRVTALLRADGVFVEGQIVEKPPLLLNVLAEGARRQVVGSRRSWRLRARIGQPGRARAELAVSVPGRSRPVIISASRRFAGRAVWNEDLRLPRVVLTAAARAPLRASLVVTVSQPTPLAAATASHTIGPLRLVGARQSG